MTVFLFVVLVLVGLLVAMSVSRDVGIALIVLGVVLLLLAAFGVLDLRK